MSKEAYIPLPDADSLKTKFFIPLPPFVEQERIGIATRRIETLKRIGGISHLLIIGENGGETSMAIPTIVGIDKDGSALAGKVGIRREAPIFKSENFFNQDGTIPHCFQWTRAIIKLNIQEMANRIKDDNKWEKGVRTPEAWTYHLDQALKKGIEKSGWEHLVKSVSGYNLFWFGYHNIDSLLLSLHSSPWNLLFKDFGKPPEQIPSILFWLAFRNVFMNMFSRVTHFNRNKEEGTRFSFFFGPELDRAVILKLAAKNTKLSKVI